MPAPNLSIKSSTVTAQKRATRSSTNNISTKNALTKGKSTTLIVRKGTVASKNENSQDLLNKRKADQSPYADKTLKRSAFGDITNAADEKAGGAIKKVVKKPVVTTATNRLASSRITLTRISTVTSGITKKQPLTLQTTSKPAEKTKDIVKKSVVSRNKVAPVIPEIAEPAATNKICSAQIKAKEISPIPVSKPVTRQSVRLSDITASSSEESSLLSITDDKKVDSSKLPPGVDDFDSENINDPNQVSQYAFDIFNYLKSREGHYKITDYIEKQTALTKYMRSLLVDWMVEVQESFELTHETLYLAVKIVDKYLSKVTIKQDTLQLIGATSLFIASKFDEQSPPVLEDIVYIGDQAYNDRNVIETEIRILKNLDFDLGFPLSYRFLRRYARCSKTPMELLTLARFILEYCLMDYYVVTESDSKMGAAALHIARIMKNVGNWTTTLEYYSGYKLEDFKEVAIQMNDILHKRPRSSLATVRNKYSHEIFFGVAKIPLVDNERL